MQTLLMDIESKFANSSLSIADSNADSLRDIDVYNKNKGDIYYTDETIKSTLNSNNIKEMPMSKIEKMKEEFSSTLDKKPMFLGKVYSYLKNEEIYIKLLA